MAETVVEPNPEAPVTPAAPTVPGYKTTEFWHTILVTIAGCVMIVGGLHAGKDNIVEMGTILAGLTGVAYPAVRTTLKAIGSKSAS